MFQFSNKQLRAALLCYTAFLVYATLWPFDFYFAQGFLATRKISWIPFFDPSGGPERKDAMMNLLVFLPFGILFFVANSGSGKMRRPVLIGTLLGGALSFSIEVAQIGLPSRHPSAADLLMNTTGALLGALFARTLQRKVRTDPEGARLCLRRNLVPLVVIGYALALLASTMRTFDPILKWSVLGNRARAFAGSTFLPNHLDLDNTAWMVLSFGFLSFLAAEGFTGSSPIRHRPFRYPGAFIAISLYATALEVLQVFFRARHPLPSHALLGIIGAAYGVAWHAVTDRFRDASSPGKSLFPYAIPLFFTHYTALVFLAFMTPVPHSIHGFRFDFRGFIPLFFFLRDISLPSLYAAAKAIVLYIPIGFTWRWATDEMSYRSWAIPILFSVGLQAAIEIAKGFFGYQHPDPSGIFLAALGGCVGVKAASTFRSV